MSDYELVNETEWGSGNDCLRVKVFGADSVSGDELDDAFYGVNTASFDAYSASTNTSSDVDYTQTKAYETNIDFDCSESNEDERESSVRTQFNTWLDNHGFTENGTCLLVTDCDVAISWNGSWNSRVVAMVSTTRYAGPGNPPEYLKAMAAHEALHGFINHDCDDVNDLTDDDEHELGSVNSSDEVTALAASYQDGAKHHQDGNCYGYNPDDDSFTAEPTMCTIKALEHSKEHTNTGPWHDW